MKMIVFGLNFTKACSWAMVTKVKHSWRPRLLLQYSYNLKTRAEKLTHDLGGLFLFCNNTVDLITPLLNICTGRRWYINACDDTAYCQGGGMGEWSEWVSKFNGLPRTADNEAHVIHISSVIKICRQTSYTSHTLGNKIGDHSYVVETSPVSAAPTIYSVST